MHPDVRFHADGLTMHEVGWLVCWCTPAGMGSGGLSAQAPLHEDAARPVAGHACRTWWALARTAPTWPQLPGSTR